MLLWRLRPLLFSVLVAAVTASACSALPVGAPVPAGGVPGFDTRNYPALRGCILDWPSRRAAE
jgi:hypothetical protein